MQELVLFLVRVGFLVLFWAFVLAALLVIRSDLFGSPRPAKAKVPAKSGRAQPSSAPPAGAAKPRRGRSSARKLVVTEGSLAGTSIALGEAPITIGRADDSTLVLSDEYASSRHARLMPADDSWVVEDLGSTNGTYLDGERVSRPTPVPLGRPVRIGKTVLELRR